ncbi:Piso0_003457 [Millerozyma farinosa CBS 7064]|uniref:Dolichyl-diphosphooligosaccharide--protein glycosyltransferase subunit 1 n=1 Tax=Pichia sorbitophila (strain ATCC MYA-4447 / BCRC 22081 / CBS 7064 / NBRC 10061 / NRRL Y-12695) TaxID=559304 RepID=G8YI54_PICSO|nr:Piso0_003457 [Millerozyma farinosa CBS 7064]CCE81106.1 Piso0_003457 [Millerozyma farinosa CBS 7064]
MKVSLILGVVFSFLSAVLAKELELEAGNWKNKNYLRTIDLSRAYVQETCLIEAENLDSKPQDVYYFTVNDGFDVIGNISLFEVSVSNNLKVDVENVLEGVYKLKLPAPVAANSVVEIKVKYTYTNTIAPFPAKIEMGDTQKLLLKLNKFVFSPYATSHYTLVFNGISKGQEMELVLSNPEEYGVTKNAPDMRPRVENKTFVYGPSMAEITPYTVQPMGLLYFHNKPLTKAFRLDRAIWIPASDTEMLNIEEYYELTNAAAELKSGFSRVDWMKGRYETTKNHWALSHLQFPLTKGNLFQDYYFTDKVGMVSSHKILSKTLFLQPRFPVFGGWKYNFTLGWNNPVKNYVHKVVSTPDTYIVRFPVLNSIEDISYDSVSLDFYLPEGAELLKVASPVPYENVEVGNELSYLDVSKGHVKVSLKFKNLIDSLNGKEVLLMYKYTKASFWFKALKISGFVFVGLMSYYILNFINIDITSK